MAVFNLPPRIGRQGVHGCRAVSLIGVKVVVVWNDGGGACRVFYIYIKCVNVVNSFFLIQLDLGFGLFGNSVQFFVRGIQSKQ